MKLKEKNESIANILEAEAVALNSSRKLYSIISLAFGITTFIFLALALINLPNNTRALHIGRDIFKLSIKLMLMSVLAGAITSIIALARKEKIKYIKAISLVLNATGILIIVGSMILSLFAEK
jgi:hypothetical protein